MSMRGSADNQAEMAPSDTHALAEAISANSLAEGSSFAIANPDNPLQRHIVVSIKSNLNELCNQPQKGSWTPSNENLRNILMQNKFTDLKGSTEQFGDLKSVVLHNMDLTHVSSSFPLSVGVKITGVDNKTYSSTGKCFSTIVLPEVTSSTAKTLQRDEVSLAYNFAKSFPGYTAENLHVKGVHEVTQRRFVLVAADHPIMSVITENADKLQLGEFSMMPEGLVKISQSLYDHVLPMVQGQVASQIKVRDFSNCSITVSPAELGSWADSRNNLILEAKRPLKAQLAAELALYPGDTEKREQIQAQFKTRQAAIEHDIDFRPMELNLDINMSYNFLAN